MDAAQRNRIGVLRPLMQYISKADNRTTAYQWAAARCGLSPKRLEKLFGEWRHNGDAALINGRIGQKEGFSRAPKLTLEIRDRLRSCALRTDSVELAIELFAKSPECPDEIRAWIRPFIATRSFPKILRSAARITPEDRAAARGQKGFHARAFTQLRDNKWKDTAGVVHDLVGGDLFECDDMSLNQPFWYEWDYGGDPLSDAHGVRLGRQMLASIDVATGKWLGFDLIGRVRDAYRAEDVVRFLGTICQTHGMPRMGFRLERNVWQAKAVRGIRGANDDDEKTIIGSIADVVDLHYVYESKAKGVIEGSFNLLQTILSFIAGIQIGRSRGEYETTTKYMQQCANSKRPPHPKDFGFLHMDEMADKVAEAMQFADERPKQGRLLVGIPQDRFVADVENAPLAQLPAEQAHLFMPVKEIKRIDQGFVRVRVPHYDHLFSFAVPPGCADLGTGYRLLVCFDPADPTAGAMVFDAETDGRRAYDVEEGQAFGTFEFVENAPQLDFSKQPKSDRKKKFLAASRTHFRATGLASGTGASVNRMADGEGTSRTIVNGIASKIGDSRAEKASQARRAREAGGKAKAEASKRAMQLFKSTPTQPCNQTA